LILLLLNPGHDQYAAFTQKSGLVSRKVTYENASDPCFCSSTNCTCRRSHYVPCPHCWQLWWHA
jgi:hypothetical protein